MYWMFCDSCFIIQTSPVELVTTMLMHWSSLSFLDFRNHSPGPASSVLVGGGWRWRTQGSRFVLWDGRTLL